MTVETALGVILKEEITSRVEVRDGEVYIKDKKEFAYTMFNRLQELDKKYVEDMINNLNRGE